MSRIIILLITLIIPILSVQANLYEEDSTDIGYTIKQKSISKRKFEKMKKLSEQYNYTSQLVDLDSATVMRYLNDSTLLNQCQFAKDLADEMKDSINKWTPWNDTRGEYGMYINKYEDGTRFLHFSYPIDQCSYLITDTTNIKVNPYTLESDATAYNKNGLLAGTEGYDEISWTFLHLYKIEGTKIQQLTYYKNYESTICELYWIGDNCMYVHSLKYKKRPSFRTKCVIKSVYYKLTFKKK